jgi:hypothetical protein
MIMRVAQGRHGQQSAPVLVRRGILHAQDAAIPYSNNARTRCSLMARTRQNMIRGQAQPPGSVTVFRRFVRQ